MKRPPDLIHVRKLVAERARGRARKARAMRPPDPAVLAYTRDLTALVDAWQSHVVTTLKPHLHIFEGSTNGVKSGESVSFLHKLDASTGVDPELQRLRDTIDAFLARQGIDSVLSQTAGRVNAWNIQELSNSLGIDVTGAGVGLGPLLETFRTENILRIKLALGGSLQDLANMLDSQMGLRVEEITTNIEAGFSVTRSRARLLARDQTLKFNANVNRQRQNEVGVSSYVWVTSHDERVRGNPAGKWPLPKGGLGGDHFSLDTHTFQWAIPPITNTKTGARNHPGEDYQCRCTATPVLAGILD